MSVPSLTELSAADRKALELSLQLDEPAKRELYEAVVLEKWDKAGWLGQASESKGFPKLEGDRAKKEVALLLENQMRFQRSQLIPVRNGHVDRSILQDTSTGDEALPTTFSLAMVRRAYALMQKEDWSVRQPLAGPTGFVWYVDFIHEDDNTNVISGDYKHFFAGEQSVPKKSKVKLNRDLVVAQKQIMGTTWTLEASEDAMAQLGLNLEQELISTFTAEFVRNIFQRHLLTIQNNLQTMVATGANLPAPWNQPMTPVTIPNVGTLSLGDWGRAIYNAVLDANGTYQKLNRAMADGIVCGIDMAVRLEKAAQAVHSTPRDSSSSSDLGVDDYGHFAGRFHIWATDLIPANVGFLYKRNPDNLRAGHIYAPYVPIQVMPAVYGGYDPATGNYQNTDEYTRNIRERSADKLTKPYAFVPLVLG